jgi:hypothetical protein
MRLLPVIFFIFAISLLGPIGVSREESALSSTGISTNAIIQTPRIGQAVQGSVEILGSNNIEGFHSAEVDFAYMLDNTHTWFLIQESAKPVQNGVLATWDTSTITDGNYTLRLLVTSTNGNQVEFSVPGVRVRNYSPIETDTPSPVPLVVANITATPVPSSTAFLTEAAIHTPILPSPSPLPSNPAELTSKQFLKTIGKGAAFTLLVFAFLAGYLVIRYFFQNR